MVKYLTGAEIGLSKENVKESMKKSLQGFAVAKLSELKEVVMYLKGEELRLSKEAIKESMKKSLHGFARVKQSELRRGG